MTQVIVGVFPNRQSAEDAIVALKEAGFDPTHIGYITRNADERQAVANEVGLDVGTGAITGGVLGGGLGAVLAATGGFVIPGVGPFVAAGILATAVAGGAAGAIVGALVGLGVPREEAEYYHRRVVQGASLVTVDAPGREREARELLLRSGAEDTWSTTPWQNPAQVDNKQAGVSAESPRAETITPAAAPYVPPQPASADRGSVVGPDDAIQHGAGTNPFAGTLKADQQSEGTMNFDEPALGQPEPPLDAGALPPNRP